MPDAPIRGTPSTSRKARWSPTSPPGARVMLDAGANFETNGDDSGSRGMNVKIAISEPDFVVVRAAYLPR